MYNLSIGLLPFICAIPFIKVVIINKYFLLLNIFKSIIISIFIGIWIQKQRAINCNLSIGRYCKICNLSSWEYSLYIIIGLVTNKLLITYILEC